MVTPSWAPWASPASGWARMTWPAMRASRPGGPCARTSAASAGPPARGQRLPPGSQRPPRYPVRRPRADTPATANQSLDGPAATTRSPDAIRSGAQLLAASLARQKRQLAEPARATALHDDLAPLGHSFGVVEEDWSLAAPTAELPQGNDHHLPV